jgi:hypothetical protein
MVDWQCHKDDYQTSSGAVLGIFILSKNPQGQHEAPSSHEGASRGHRVRELGQKGERVGVSRRFGYADRRTSMELSHVDVLCLMASVHFWQ